MIDHEMESAVVTGTALGRSLRRALVKLQDEDEVAAATAAATTAAPAAGSEHPADEGEQSRLCQRLLAGKGPETDDKVTDDGNEDDEGQEKVEEDSSQKIKVVDETETSTVIRMTGSAADQILQSFATAAGSMSDEVKQRAPRALIRGRCDYYNRMGQNWRVVIDHVELKRRPLPHEMTKRRRLMKDRESLWDRNERLLLNAAPDQRDNITATSRADNNTASSNVIRLTTNPADKVQLLAYGDTP